MFGKRRTALGALALLLVVPGALGAQARQQERMHQHMERMDAMMQRMDRIQDRIHKLDRTMAKQMDRMQDQQRLREHQALRDMCTATGAMVRQMKQNVERMRGMMDEPLFQRDQEMQRQMERLHEHWDEMGARLEESVQIMERMHQHMGAGGAGQPPGAS